MHTMRRQTVPLHKVRALIDERDQLAADSSQLRRHASQLTEQVRGLTNDLAEARAQRPPGSERLQADLANIRRNQAQTEARVRTEANRAAALHLAEVHTSLSRALAANPDTESPWFVGTAGILAQVRQSLAALGAHPTGGPGEAFNPNQHEALGVVPTADVPPGTIAVTDQLGFVFEDGSLLRPAKVVVTSEVPHD